LGELVWQSRLALLPAMLSLFARAVPGTKGSPSIRQEEAINAYAIAINDNVIFPDGDRQ
jgi:hypothetical protein